jgi:hypothetical protein
MIVSVTFVCLIAAGVAYAAWTASGTGSGYAKAGTAQELTTDTVAVTSGLLAPGLTGNVFVKITNPNTYAVQVTDVDRTGAITSGDATCDASDSVTFTDQNITQNIAAGATTTVTLTNAVSMSNASVNACQGKTFTIPVTLTGASA